MKKVKIMTIIARLNIGGTAVHTILLADGLDKSRFDSMLVCGSLSKDEGDMSYYAVQKNIKPIFIPDLKRKINLVSDFAAFKNIFKLIKAERPDIIHTHTAKAGALGRLAGIIYNFFSPQKQIKIVHTFHGHIFEGYFSKFKTKIFILIERLLAIFTHRIITLSESIKRDLVSLGIGNENKIEVIPLGFELDGFLHLLPRENMSVNIGIVGRLVPVKNHRLFLRAAGLVMKTAADIKLRFKIIGNGELRQELEEYAFNLGIRERVDFLGWQKDILEVYSGLDIVALTSVNEGTPVSLIESMASAKPIVATDVGGVRDLLGKEIGLSEKTKGDFKVLERGIIVQSDDVTGFAAALAFLLQNKELRRNMGTLGREFVKDRFSRIRLIKDIENLYILLLGWNNPPYYPPFF